jgi:hypothetical protein
VNARHLRLVRDDAPDRVPDSKRFSLYVGAGDTVVIGELLPGQAMGIEIRLPPDDFDADAVEACKAFIESLRAPSDRRRHLNPL